MRNISVRIEEDDEIRIYADSRLSQDDIIKYLDNALSVMKDKPMKATFYTRSNKK